MHELGDFPPWAIAMCLRPLSASRGWSRFERGVFQLPSHVQWEGYLRARLGKETATLSGASVSSVEKDYLLSIQSRE